MKLRGIVFDLDGTLVDSLTEIAWAVNQARGRVGLPELPVEPYSSWVGRGLRHLVASMLGDENDPRVDPMVDDVRTVYEAHGGERAEAYEGIEPLLTELRSRGLQLAVLTNKPDLPAKRLVKHRFEPETFAVVIGQRDGHPVKPDPTAALAIMKQLGGEPSEWWFVGDMTVDIETAHAAGMTAVAVTWGITSEEHNEQTLRDAGADLIIHHPSELLSAIDSAASASPARHSI